MQPCRKDTTGARYDVERTDELCARLACSGRGAVINLAGRMTLAQTARVLEEATAVVSVNTGIMHLAAAVGTVILGLNGPVPGSRWGPLGDRAVSVEAHGEGCGYLNLGFEYKNQRIDCMDLIEPHRVLRLLKESLEERQGNPAWQRVGAGHVGEHR